MPPDKFHPHLSRSSLTHSDYAIPPAIHLLCLVRSRAQICLINRSPPRGRNKFGSSEWLVGRSGFCRSRNRLQRFCASCESLFRSLSCDIALSFCRTPHSPPALERRVCAKSSRLKSGIIEAFVPSEQSHRTASLFIHFFVARIS